MSQENEPNDALANAEKHKAFIELSDDDITILKALHEHLVKDPAFFVDEFYAHLLDFEATRVFIPDEKTLDLLKSAQIRYFSSLTEGAYDQNYLSERIRIGKAHQGIGLEPRWYTGAYRKFLSLLIPRIHEFYDDPDKAVEATLSLLKVIFLDIGIAMETYVEADHQVIARRANQLSALNKVAVTVNSTLGFNTTVNAVMKGAMQILDAQAVAIALVDKNRRCFTDIHTQGLSNRFVNNMRFRRGGLADEVFTTRSYVLSNDRRGCKHKLSKLIRAEGIRAFICLPLISQNRRLGVLYLYFKNRDLLQDDEYPLLETLSHIATGAIGNACQHSQAVSMAITDDLTGLFNRREFINRLNQEMQRSLRSDNPLSIIMLDVDYFKQINDVHGHLAGDTVLVELANVFIKETRKIDVIARYGGEEFIFLLPETSESKAVHYAERIRKLVAEHRYPIPGNKEIELTISFGVACFPEDADNENELVECADRALYTAKQLGRNQTIAYSEMAQHRDSKIQAE